ncbi:MAG: hypothetical protein ACRDDI_13445 [Aeromonas veronii]
MITVTVTIAGKVVNWLDAVAQMDNDICRSLEGLYPCTEQYFCDQYAQTHQKVFGVPFEVK